MVAFGHFLGRAAGPARKFLIATSLGSIALGAMAAPAMAAPRPLTMDIFLGDTCVSGGAKKGTVMKIVFKGADGTSKGKSVALVDDTGYWDACSDYFADPLAAGDTVKLHNYDTGQTLSYKIPLLTLHVDRVTDIVKGKGPKGSTVRLEAADSNGPLYGRDPFDIIKKLTVNSRGKWKFDFGKKGIDLIAGSLLELRLSGKNGRVHVYRDLAVPGLELYMGQSVFDGYGRPYTDVGITLTNGSGKVVATGDGVADGAYWGAFSGRFVDHDGEFYKLKGGEHLSAPALGTNSSWIVPKINPQINAKSDKVSGHCVPNNPFVVLAGYFGYELGITTGSGAFSVDFTGQGGFGHGDEVTIVCLASGGDLVIQDLLVK